MIDKKQFSDLKAQYPFLTKLPEKLLDIISDKIAPESKVLNMVPIKIEGKDGGALFTETEMMAFWMSKFLFKKLPTYQSFHYTQINELKQLSETTIQLHASADAKVLDDDYEEGTFTFQSSLDCRAAVNLIGNYETRLN